jgi:hypothetical protein
MPVHRSQSLNSPGMHCTARHTLQTEDIQSRPSLRDGSVLHRNGMADFVIDDST